MWDAKPTHALIHHLRKPYSTAKEDSYSLTQNHKYMYMLQVAQLSQRDRATP